MVVEILVSTINAGILRVAQLLLPPREKIRYFISWQHTDQKQYAIPEELATRHDVTLQTCAESGLSKNRNNTLRHASGDILVIADDDCVYTPEYLANLQQAFADRPEAQILCFQAQTLKGDYLKDYPHEPFALQHRPKGYYPSSVEIALRKNDAIPLFDERFGLGSAYLACGEEEIFLFDALKAQVRAEYIPMPIVKTTAETTGRRFLSDAAIRRSKGAVLCYMHGPIGALLRCSKEVAQLRGVSLKQRLVFLRDTWRGIKYIAYGRKG